jgi:ribosomal-protein-alanine N-acetyltransferase
MQTTAVRYLVRPMGLGDISQVMEIERESFRSMWPPTAFKRELRHNRLARYLVVVERPPDVEESPSAAETPMPGPGGESPGLGRFLTDLRRLFGTEGEPGLEATREPIVGMVGVWLMVDEAHIVTIAVVEGHRRRGIGELLLIAAIELADINDRPLVTLECRMSNEAAQALYEKYGFRRVGVRRRYYSDDQEDAAIMTTESILTPSYQALFQRLKEEHRARCGPYDLKID